MPRQLSGEDHTKHEQSYSRDSTSVTKEKSHQVTKHHSHHHSKPQSHKHSKHKSDLSLERTRGSGPTSPSSSSGSDSGRRHGHPTRSDSSSSKPATPDLSPKSSLSTSSSSGSLKQDEDARFVPESQSSEKSLPGNIQSDSLEGDRAGKILAGLRNNPDRESSAVKGWFVPSGGFSFGKMKITL